MKKTLLIGAGAIGGTLAVLMKEAGYDISVLCYNDEIKNLITEKGFYLHGAKGEHHVQLNCYASFEEFEDEKFDIVIIATKFQAVAGLAEKVLGNL